MDQIVQKRSSGLSTFGIFLIFLGVGLILHRLSVIHFGWAIIFWICLGVAGFAAAVQAFITRRRGVVFWGSLSFFVSIAMLIHKFAIFDFVPWDIPATFSLAIGLAFLMLFFYDPRRFGVIIPVLLFGGYGVIYYLWWLDIIDWIDMNYYFRTYWPVLIIIWGLSLIFHRRR